MEKNLDSAAGDSFGQASGLKKESEKLRTSTNGLIDEAKREVYLQSYWTIQASKKAGSVLSELMSDQDLSKMAILGVLAKSSNQTSELAKSSEGRNFRSY